MEEVLKGYNGIDAEIDKLKWKIALIENEEVQASSPSLEVTGIKSKGYKTNNIENKVVNNVDKISKYKRKIVQLEAKKQMINSMINTLNEIEKEVIEARYKDLLKWEDIAIRIDRDVSRAKEIKRNAIRKMDKIYYKQD